MNPEEEIKYVRGKMNSLVIGDSLVKELSNFMIDNICDSYIDDESFIVEVTLRDLLEFHKTFRNLIQEDSPLLVAMCKNHCKLVIDEFIVMASWSIERFNAWHSKRYSKYHNSIV